MKFNINPFSDVGALVPNNDLCSLVTGLNDGIFAMGRLSHAIKKIEASFTYNGGLALTIHFVDPLGNESFHATDYRFIGKKSLRPSAEEICEIFLPENHLANFIRVFLLKAEKKLEHAREVLRIQLET